MKILILKKRKDFVRAAKGLKSVRPTLVLQAAQSLSAPNKPILDDGCYLGFTATKKIGKAYKRNRTKRRLRAVAFEYFANYGLSGVDYVLVGRFHTADSEFSKLKSDMKHAIKDVNNQIKYLQSKKNEKATNISD